MIFWVISLTTCAFDVTLTFHIKNIRKKSKNGEEYLSETSTSTTNSNKLPVTSQLVTSWVENFMML